MNYEIDSLDLKLGGLAEIPWEEFRSKAISASSIAEWWFCQAKITNAKLYGSMETPETLEGTQLHEEEATKIIEELGPLEEVEIQSLLDAMLMSRRNIDDALKRREFLANSEDTILVRSICPEIGYVGLPDSVDCSNGTEPIVVELKTTGRLPSYPWMDHQVQLGAYMIGLERLGYQQSYGRLAYKLRTNPTSRIEFKVKMNDRLRESVLSSARSVIGILGGSDPKPTTNSNKCRSCSYSDLCQWSLYKSNP